MCLTKEESKEKLNKVDFSHILDFGSARKLPYRRRNNEFKITLSWEQRKLLLSEIFFLSEYGNLSSTVLYIGAAPGNHINYLSSLFPIHKFILYDSSDFHLVNSDNLVVNKGDFSDQTAFSFVNKDILFMSNINKDPISEYDKMVKYNMECQQRWHLIMKPKMSLMQFRLPYEPGETEYLVGDIYFQSWIPSTSTECIMITNSDRIKIYDHTEYEQIMYRHNLLTRIQWFAHNIRGEGIDHCYDCRLEIDILQKYIKKVNKIIDENEIRLRTKYLSQDISKKLGSSRSLLNPPHGELPDFEYDQKIDYLYKKYR